MDSLAGSNPLRCQKSPRKISTASEPNRDASWQLCPIHKGVGNSEGRWRLGAQSVWPSQQHGNPWVAFSSSLETTSLLLEDVEWSGILEISVCGGTKKPSRWKGELKEQTRPTKGSLCALLHLAHQESPVKKHQTDFTVRKSSALGGFPEQTVN